MIYAGAGNDTVGIAGQGNNTIDLGAGNDTLNFLHDRGNQTVTAGDGNDTVTLYSYNGGDISTVDGGAGDDLLKMRQTNVNTDGWATATYNATTTFRGGTGNDRLEGSAGTDIYLFDRGDGADTIHDNPTGYGSPRADTVRFGAGINPLDLVFSRSGNNLVLSTHGTTDSVTIENWYASSVYQIETMRAGDNSTLVNTQVEQLIQAMATFSAENGGITWNQAIDQRPDDVQAILAANWMPTS